MTVATQLPEIFADAQAAKASRKRQRFARPLVRLWDGDWNLRGICGAEISADFRWVLNQAGTGILTLPVDNYLAEWAVDINGRTTQNVHITVDKDGARWDGRLEKAVLATDEHGVTTVELMFMHSYQELKHIYCWSNPFLPAAVQFPREFLLAGPSVWVLKTALFVNLLRLQGQLSWALPADPIDINQWASLDMSNWPVVVVPTAYATDTSIWTIFGSRFKNFHEAAAGTLESAQLAVTTRRWLQGDPPPWPGANLRNGALVIDIVDKSGFTTGTSTSGNVWDGLQHTIEMFESDWLGMSSNVLPDPDAPALYKNPGWMGTLPSNPWVVYRQNEYSGIQTSQFVIAPSSSVQILTGGHSAPGVNEAISSAIQFCGMIIGGLLGEVPYAGPLLQGVANGATEVVNTIAMALLSDTLLAWVQYEAPDRAAASGWSHYYEHFETSADRAYTLGSLLTLGEGLWKTRRHFTHKFTVANGQPYLIGDQGMGHFFLGDRVGSTVKGMPAGSIYVDQVTELELAWSRTASPAWQITVGTDHDHDMPFAKSMRVIADIVDEIHELAVQM
ncbi:Gp37-like protein [Nocardia elegans]|uniref:Phage tail protein n=1 Tax=Nocardia nova TaxID=37330 RepID=A0A2T2YRA6_9NOCA|nr:phage tail protein [Nocardia nova]